MSNEKLTGRLSVSSAFMEQYFLLNFLGLLFNLSDILGT